MVEIIQIPVELTHFQLPEAVQERLQFLLYRQDVSEALTSWRTTISRRVG